MIKKTFFVISILAFCSPVFAQQQESGKPNLSNLEPSLSILNPSRFHMSQSYSFMYSSSGYGSYSLGMYLNSLEYQVSDPLRIRIDVAYVHQPGALFSGTGAGSQNGMILPGISVNWQPSKYFQMRFDYRQYPSLYRGLDFESSNPYQFSGEER